MTAITFPNSPSSGDTHTAGNGIVYTYDGEKWTSIGTNSAGTWTRSGTTVSLTNAGDDLNVDSGTLFVDASANSVGLGTTDPSSYNANGDNLAIQNSGGTGSAGITIRSGTGAQGTVYFADGTSTDAAIRGYIQYSHSGDFLRLGTSSNERLRILSSGNVGIGTSAPGSTLELSSAATSAAAGVTITNTNAGGYSTAQFKNTDTSGRTYTLALGGSTAVFPGSFYLYDDTAGTVRVIVDSSGRVLIGTDTEGYASADTLTISESGNCGLTIRSGTTQNGTVAFSDATSGTAEYAGYIQYSHNYNYLAFGVQSSERMRITANAFTKHSNTGTYVSESGLYHEFYNTAGNNATLVLRHAGVSGQQYGISIGTNNDQNNTTNYLIAAYGASTNRFIVKSNGGIHNYSGNNVNLCDEREKKNIEVLDSTWDCLKNWELKKFHYNEDVDTEDKRYGVIAQQVAPHCPELITNWIKQEAKDAELDDDGNVITPAQEEITRLGVKEQQMTWMAIKALQEAQTRIETLEQRLSDAGIA